MKTEIMTFSRFELELPVEALEACYHQGQCDSDVEYWVDQVSIQVEPSTLAAELKEYGAWDDSQLADHEENKRRILWIAAGDYHDQAGEA